MHGVVAAFLVRIPTDLWECTGELTLVRNLLLFFQYGHNRCVILAVKYYLNSLIQFTKRRYI